LRELYSSQSLKQLLVYLILILALQLLQHLHDVCGVVDQQGGAETLDEVGQDHWMRILRKDGAESLEFVL
jgi:hypothetical protein